MSIGMNDLLRIIDPVPTLWAAGLGFLLLLALAVFFAFLFDRYRGNLPLVALGEALDVRIDERRQRLADIEAAIAEKEAALPEAERLRAEAGFWREQIDTARVEFEGLAETRAEVARLRAETQVAVEARARDEAAAETAARHLAALRDAADAVERRTVAAEALVAEKRAEIEAITARLVGLRPEVERMERLAAAAAQADERVREAENRAGAAEERRSAARAAVEEAEAELARLRREIDRAGRDLEAAASAERRVAEAVEREREAEAARIVAERVAAGAEQRAAAADVRLAELGAKTAAAEVLVAAGDRARLEAEAAERRRIEAEAARVAAEERAMEKREAADTAAARLASLQPDLRRAEAQIAEAVRAREVADVAKKRQADAESAAERAAARIEALGIAEAAAREAAASARSEVEALTRKLAELAGAGAAAAAGSAGGGPAHVEAFAELAEAPPCLTAPGWTVGRNPAQERATEAAILNEVAEHLERCGLSFPTRVLKAFHTSLKINDVAQLTVLAGVSGTGKSQLPRRYAEAMGIHFLQIPVQPRWDSPQDLIGFYNYLEKKYRATEFVRALAHLDSARFPDRALDDRMLLVLLDEMNLARVEYYFSEFLSRLEARPRPGEGPRLQQDAETRLEAQGIARTVYAGHNVLFVGTMNEDESTQSLSDKVLDRANQLRFPKPVRLAGRSQGAADPLGADRYLSYASWRAWCGQRLTETDARTVAQTVEDLNDLCASVGKGFGHRMRQAIEAYVAQYPRPGEAAPVAAALADQIEMRILPRLRGLNVEEDAPRTLFEQLAATAGEKLDDDPLSDAITRSVESARGAGGLFVWQGLTRG
jgi:hypothetical protein